MTGNELCWKCKNCNTGLSNVYEAYCDIFQMKFPVEGYSIKCEHFESIIANAKEEKGETGYERLRIEKTTTEITQFNAYGEVEYKDTKEDIKCMIYDEQQGCWITRGLNEND